MSKRIINDFYSFSCSELDGLTISEAISLFKHIENELRIEENAIEIFFVGDSIPYEGESLSIKYTRYETDKEYEQRLKRDFDAAEKLKIQKIQEQYGKNYILLQNEEFFWEDKAFKVEYVDENTFNGLLDSLKKSDK